MSFRIFENWAFVNYCFQRVGMWDKNDLNSGVNHAFKIQITNLILPFFSIPYLYFDAPRGIYTFIFLIPFVALSFYLCKKLLTQKIIDLNLEERYDNVSRGTRIFGFVAGIVITILCVVYFISSFWLIPSLK